METVNRILNTLKSNGVKYEFDNEWKDGFFYNILISKGHDKIVDRLMYLWQSEQCSQLTRITIAYHEPLLYYTPDLGQHTVTDIMEDFNVNRGIPCYLGGDDSKYLYNMSVAEGTKAIIENFLRAWEEDGNPVSGKDRSLMVGYHEGTIYYTPQEA